MITSKLNQRLGDIPQIVRAFKAVCLLFGLRQVAAADEYAGEDEEYEQAGEVEEEIFFHSLFLC